MLPPPPIKLSIMKIFHDSGKMYIEALKSSRFREEFTNQEPKIPNENNLNKGNSKCDNQQVSRKNRKRKIIWFKPTFCKLVNINIGKYFLKLMDKHFNQNNILHKIFNRKILKN